MDTLPEKEEQLYMECLGNALRLHSKLEEVHSELDIKIHKLMYHRPYRKGLQGPSGFRGGVHLVEVLAASRSLRARILKQQERIAELDVFDPLAACQEIESYVSEFA